MNDSSAVTRTLAGSERQLPAGALEIGPVDDLEQAGVSIILRPRVALRKGDLARRATLSREAYAARHGATEEDLLRVTAFLHAAGLTVEASDPARRTIEASGTLAALAGAFGTRLARYRAVDGSTYRGRVGSLCVPEAVADCIRGVFGLDERAQARAQFVRAKAAAIAHVPQAGGLTPLEIAAAYGFPASDGAGQTIALIELGGGFVASDLTTYFASLGVTAPSVVAVSVDGASNAPTGDPNGPDAEVALDIEVAGALVPAAKIVVYFAPNTDRGFLDAITTAVHDTTNAPTIVSISWGGPESTWTAQATASFDDAFAAAAELGITVTAAAGDSGSSDGVADGAAHVDFPASSPHALACGGTRLTLADGAIASETVWNDGASGGATGGGVSDIFPPPVWQSAAKIPPSVNPGARLGRGVPDVSGNADPQTGYRTLVDGTVGVIGGTSAVAPLWAGLVARLNAAAGTNHGFITPQLYGAPAALRDIVSGTNGAYAALPGWDACTGLGSPAGASLATLFARPGASRP